MADPVHRAFARRFGRPVDVHRGRARVSAFVYGNILVLAAVAVATPHDVETGHAALVVVGTTLSTFLAHVVAHAVGGAIGADPSRPRPRAETREELRDATPILSSGTLPTLLLLAGWLLDPAPGLAVALAGAAVVVRLAGMGLVVARLSGLPPSRRQLLAGVLLAGVSIAIVALKVVLTH